MHALFERLWIWLRPYASPGAAVTGGVATYSLWEAAYSWVFSQLPEGLNHWFLQNVLSLPAWAAATIVGSLLFAVIAWVQYRAAMAELSPKLKIYVPADYSMITQKPFDERQQQLAIEVKNTGTNRLTKIELYIYCIEPKPDIAASMYKYRIPMVTVINGGDFQRVFLIGNRPSETSCSFSSREGPLLSKEEKHTLYLRVTCAESAPAEAVLVLEQDKDKAGNMVLREKKWL